MSWTRGAAAIEALLRDRRLESVQPSGDLADRLLADAEAHLTTARMGVDEDPVRALQLAYDAARKSAAALLAAQGLRSTTTGGHAAVAAAASAQFDGTFDDLDRMRRRRHDAEYPDLATPDTTPADAEHTMIRRPQCSTRPATSSTVANSACSAQAHERHRPPRDRLPDLRVGFSTR